jgi:hypothetical protein
MKMQKLIASVLAGAALLAFTPRLSAQQEFFTREDVIKYTPDWHGERFPDGRPKVPDEILDRMKNVTLEEAWATLRSAGFNHEYEDGWLSIHPDQVLVGRALTATWMPGRPDIQKVIEDQGVLDHRKGSTNAWPVDMLQPRDVYVADHWGQRRKRDLCKLRKRDRLRWRRPGYQRIGRTAELYVICALLRPLSPLWKPFQRCEA